MVELVQLIKPSLADQDPKYMVKQSRILIDQFTRQYGVTDIYDLELDTQLTSNEDEAMMTLKGRLKQ